MFLIVSALALIGGGCGRSDTPIAAGPETIHVLAMVYPMVDVVRQIGGPFVTVDWVAEGGHDPRDVEGTEDARKKLQWASFIVSSGFDDTWATQNMSDAYRQKRMLLLDVTPTGREDSVKGVGQAALWLDPQVVIESSDLIRDRLSVQAPMQAPEFRARASALQEDLRTLIAKHTPRFAALRQKRILVLRPTWSALGNRFGFEELHPIDAQPERVTDAQARTLRDTARREGLQTLILDSVPPPAVARDLEDRTHLTLLPLDLVGSSASTGHRTYQEVLRYDLEELEKAMGAVPRTEQRRVRNDAEYGMTPSTE